jgi:hypothetical protein
MRYSWGTLLLYVAVLLKPREYGSTMACGTLQPPLGAACPARKNVTQACPVAGYGRKLQRPPCRLKRTPERDESAQPTASACRRVCTVRGTVAGRTLVMLRKSEVCIPAGGSRGYSVVLTAECSQLSRRQWNSSAIRAPTGMALRGYSGYAAA